MDSARVLHSHFGEFGSLYFVNGALASFAPARDIILPTPVG